MKKPEVHVVDTTRKVIQHRGVNIREIVGECEVEDVISSVEVSDTLRPSSCVGFTNEVKELQMGSLGESVDLMSIKGLAVSFAFP